MSIIDDLKTLDPNDPGRWPAPVRGGAVVLCFVVLASVLFYFLVWSDQKPKLEQAQKQEEELRATFKFKHSKAVNLAVYQQQLADIERSFGALLRQLPGRTEVPNLLVDISQVGVGAGLEEKLFQPSPEVKKDFYAELPIKIKLTGSYHQMGEFVSGIAALPRIVTLHEMTIKTDNKDAYDQLSFELTAKTFRYLDDAEVAAVEKAKAAEKKGKKNVQLMNGENAGTDMFSKRKSNWLLISAACLAVSALAGCSSKDDELDQFILDTEKEPGGRVEPLPELKPYETYTYESSIIRSPFMPGGSGAAPGLRPDSRRNREFLEQFSLDTLRMVGTLRMSDRTYGLVKTKDGLVYRVLPGSYMGQADGKVTEVSPSKISVVELVPDGVGGYMERAASLALN